MDLEAIERALEGVDELAILRRYHPGDIGVARGLIARSQGVMLQYGPDLLRLVRAMRWMETNKADVHPYRNEWICEGSAWDDDECFGATVIEAIEAAIADRQ